MVAVYFLFYQKINRYYIGSLADLELRLEQHLNKTFRGSFTSRGEDWELYFAINELGYEQARKIEAHIKKMKSRRFI